MKITFLGTNGWYATKTGNTVCAVIETSFNYIVLDAGDGLYRLDSVATNKNKPIAIFLSHFHLDHLIGLHIQPKFHFEKEVRIFGQPGTKKVLAELIAEPYTAPFSRIKTKVSIQELKEGKNSIEIASSPSASRPIFGASNDKQYNVTCLPLIHADPCWGFRFEVDNKIIAYCTDTGPCDNLIELGKDADILILECAFLSGAPLSKDWPHLNPEVAAELAKKAKCKELILTHFDASRYDTLKKRKDAEKVAKKTFPNTLAATDMMCVEV